MADEYVYEPVSDLAAALSKGLDTIWIRLGRPRDLSTASGWVVLDNIIQVWRKYYPHEVAQWTTDRKEDLIVERSVKEHIKGGGYNPVTYPPTLYALMKAMFPDQKLNDKKFLKQLTDRYPLFKTTNLKL